MSIDVAGWTTRSRQPSPSEVLASLRATVTGTLSSSKPWKRAGGSTPASVDAFLTTHEIVLSSPSGLHLTASLRDVTDVVSLWGSMDIKAKGQTVTLEASRAELAPFAARLEEARQGARVLAGTSMGEQSPTPVASSPGRGTVEAPQVPAWADGPPAPALPRGRSLTWRNLLFVALAAVAAYAAYATLWRPPDPERHDSGRITSRGKLLIEDLQVGDCFDEGFLDELAGRVTALPCADPHTYEVFAIFDLPFGDAADFPTDKELYNHGTNECDAQFADYVGTPYERSDLDVWWWEPSPGSWRAGDREVICVAEAPDDKLAGSVRASGR